MIQHNKSLKALNTFGINVNALLYAEFANIAELLELIQTKEFASHPSMILGGGSNVLFSKNYDGLVLANRIKGIEVVEKQYDTVIIKAGAGEAWHQLVIYCIENSYGGVENLSLIPGSVGAGPMQNIGAYGVEIKNVFDSLEAINLRTGALESFSAKDCEFGYRESVFKNKLKDQYVITTVSLKLTLNHKVNTSYGAIEAELSKQGINSPSIKDISDAVIRIRQSKLPDPATIGNAGSFFKNPEISATEYSRLQTEFPAIVGYKLDNGNVKLAAGWLIEQCGWKGKRIGNTGSHKDQALVLVNYGDATGQEVYALALKIKNSVLEKFKVPIVPEVNLI